MSKKQKDNRVLKIHFFDWLEWWLDDADRSNYEALISYYSGQSDDIRKNVKKLSQFLSYCGYLPERFVGNREEFLAEFEGDEEIDSCSFGDFKIKWI